MWLLFIPWCKCAHSGKVKLQFQPWTVLSLEAQRGEKAQWGTSVDCLNFWSQFLLRVMSQSDMISFCCYLVFCFIFCFYLKALPQGESLYGEVQLTAFEELPQWISTGCFEYLIWRGFFVIYLSINHWLFIPLLWLALFLMNFIQTLKYGCHRSFSVPYRTSSCIHILSAAITGTWHYVQLNFNSMKIMISGKRDSRLI